MSSSRRNPFVLPELSRPPAVGASLAYTIADPRDTNFDELGAVRVRKVSGGWEVDVTRPGSDAELLRGALTKKVVHKDWARAARAVRMTLEQFHKKGFEVERSGVGSTRCRSREPTWPLMPARPPVTPCVPSSAMGGSRMRS